MCRSNALAARSFVSLCRSLCLACEVLETSGKGWLACYRQIALEGGPLTARSPGVLTARAPGVLTARVPGVLTARVPGVLTARFAESEN